MAGGAPGKGEAAPGDHLQSDYRLWLAGHQLEHGRAPWIDPYSFQPEAGSQVNAAWWPFGLPYWPLDRLLGSLSQLGPGASVAPLLVAVVLGLVVLVALASAWPAWRATRGPAGSVLRRGDATGSARRLPGGGGPAGLGLRMTLARPARTAGGIVVLGSAVVVILLIFAIASLLLRLDSNPVAVGKRYQLTASAPISETNRIARLPGVEAAAPRYELNAADSFDLGEPFTLIAFPGDHTRFEAPPLAEGRRLRGPDEAEVGLGLAQVLNLSPGATLAAQLPSGREARFRVVGVVRALERQGRVAYVQPQQLAGEAPYEIAIRLRPSASASESSPAAA